MTITRFWEAGFGCDGANSHVVEFASVAGVIACSSDADMLRKIHLANWSDITHYGQLPTFPANTRQLRTGMFVLTGNYTSYDVTQLGLFSAGLGDIVSLLATSAGHLELYVDGALVETYTGVLSLTTWHHWGLDVKIDPTDGWVKFYLDGVLQGDGYEGNTGNTDIAYQRVGSWDSSVPNVFLAISYAHLFTDLTAGELSWAPIPGTRFIWLNYLADGDHAQWDPSTGVDHTAMIDDVPNNGDTDYNGSVEVGEIDTFTHDDLVLPAGYGVAAVLPGAIVRKLDATATRMSGVARHGTTDLVGDEQDLEMNYRWHRSRMTTRPGGGDWDTAYVNASQFGYASEGTI